MLQKRNFAAFDIDGTVIRWQLYHAIVGELARQGFLSKTASQEIRDARMTWKRRSHAESYKAYEHALVHAYYESLATVAVEDYLRTVDEVFETYKDQVYMYTRDLIIELKRKDYILFAISGSHHEIIAKLAGYYGFDDYLGNVHEHRNGRFTGQFEGVVSRKGTILREMVEKHGLSYEGSIAIGDSESDASMFELVEHPIAFNPSAGLFEQAKQQGWKVVIERKNMIYELTNRDGQYILD